MESPRIAVGFAMHPLWLGHATAEEFLAPLKALGVTGLEFTLEPNREVWPRMASLVAECQDLGYACHFHAPYAEPNNCAGWSAGRREEIAQLYAPVIDFAERRAVMNPVPPVLVVHGARAAAGRAALVDDSAGFLHWILERAPSLNVVLELLPREMGKVKVGEKATELMEVLERVGSPRLGLCWDLGHMARNGRLGDEQRLPVGFLHRVRHVHVHDLDDTGEDHYPLVYGNVAIGRYVAQLKRAGFAGAAVLELNGHRLPRFGADGPAMVRQSVRRLAELVGAAPGPAASG